MSKRQPFGISGAKFQHENILGVSTPWFSFYLVTPPPPRICPEN